MWVSRQRSQVIGMGSWGQAQAMQVKPYRLEGARGSWALALDSCCWEQAGAGEKALRVKKAGHGPRSCS